MSDTLSAWVGANRKSLESRGFVVVLKDQHPGGSVSVDLDDDVVVGTITHWPEDRFEFHFMSSTSGRVILIKERTLPSLDAFSSYFERMVKDVLAQAE